MHLLASAFRKAGEDWRGHVEGVDLGVDATLLFFETEEVGKGPKLHWHPYAEIFIILEGSAAYTIGDQQLTAHAGDVLVGPATIPHSFRNLGPGRLRTLDVHMSDCWVQTDLE
ncbi:cupin domain-containing protein [Oceaniglobus indicus]|uniref:cupin domain-containing protein n=1 Tax=Oceaniglobus indicus TaxID=2047749 RepID=UPI001F4EDC86|nr:cupin domain-containing protein [Oceaniglobus indicus]